MIPSFFNKNLFVSEVSFGLLAGFFLIERVAIAALLSSHLSPHWSLILETNKTPESLIALDVRSFY